MAQDEIPHTLAEFEAMPWRDRVPWQSHPHTHPRIIIPGYMRDAIADYVEFGRYIGDFLTAVMSNNLKEAVWRADDVNQAHLPDYAYFLANYAPSLCSGSPEKVEEWHAIGGLVGILKANEADKAKAAEEPPETALGWRQIDGDGGDDIAAIEDL